MRQQSSVEVSEWQRAFVEKHRLPEDYLSLARRWFDPLSTAIKRAREGQAQPLLVGINGSQGSGKSTLSDYLQYHLSFELGLSAVALSLDDVYHTKAFRQKLSEEVHPLLATRGVPGTHEVGLLVSTLEQLLRTSANSTGTVSIPQFDKAMDDRCPNSDWVEVDGPVDVILLEGWCLGVTPVTESQLELAVNQLEQHEDSHLIWRRYVNDATREHLLPLYAMIDVWVMLQAPSFGCVFAWRQEQEQKLRDKHGSDPDNAMMDDEALERFVAHFERQTKQCLDNLPTKVNHLYQLNEAREIVSYTVDESKRFDGS